MGITDWRKPHNVNLISIDELPLLLSGVYSPAQKVVKHPPTLHSTAPASSPQVLRASIYKRQPICGFQTVKGSLLAHQRRS